MTAVLNDILNQVDYRTQSEYNDKGCTHFIELSSIACNKIPCLFYTIDLEREKGREKGKEAIKAVLKSIHHQIGAFSGEYEQSSFQLCHPLQLLTKHFHKSLCSYLSTK